MTTRTQNLRQAFIKKQWRICPERARIITESYRETEGEPIALRRAKAFKKILEEMTIFIEEGQLIAGNLASQPKTQPVFPEFTTRVIDDMDTFEKASPKVLVDEETKQLLRELQPYWKGKTVDEYIEACTTQDLPYAQDIRKAEELNVFARYGVRSGFGIFAANYAKVLNRGLAQTISEAKQALSNLDLSQASEAEKAHFFEAMIIACNAVMNFAKRYAAKARKLAEKESDLQRRAELERIAETCERVPANPARTFHEALQSLFFLFLTVQIESNGRSIALGRFDQYMYPFYIKDIREKRIAREEALELLECLFLKIASVWKLRDSAANSLRVTMYSNVTIGGQTREGKDATNDMSYLVLEAQKNIQMIQPTLSLRYFDGTPQELLLKATECVSTGIGMPAFFSDTRIVPATHRSNGYSIKEARDYCLAGCVVPVVAGRTQPWLYSGILNALKCLELALNSGVDPRTDVKIGATTPDFRTFKSIEDILKAFRAQVDYFINMLNNSLEIVRRGHSSLVPLPFASALFDNIMKTSKTISEKGSCEHDAPPLGWMVFIGDANVADSLAAIKKFVYDERVLSLTELKDACATNFEGKEDLRLMLLNKAPKFGNDDDYVDSIMAEVLRLEVESWPKPNHDLQSASFHIPMGKVCLASPDGRKAGEALADGGVSPMLGRDKQGPTAVIKSATKLDPENDIQMYLLNMKFDPALFRSKQGMEDFVALIRTYLDLKGFHIQFNVVSPETLKAAQREPEKYADLIVRVSGFSAYFVELRKDMQDNIIARTTFTNIA